MPRTYRMNSDFRILPIIQRQRMQQIGLLVKCHTRQQREIVASLQQPKMLLDSLPILLLFR